MTTFADVPQQTGSYLSRTEAWLDARGKGAWIAAMVLGFILFWPVGLALLAFMLFRGKFQGGGCATRRARFTAHGSSGNAAFDAYRTETLRRLEDEQEAFEKFLKRLREAKDKAEFDQFMDERAKKRDNDQRESEDA
ncbi:Protein of unknown function [Palleronia salina]|uniref:DUF2852 domain-containing protein n=2 Tax=Palleronia TaxID=315422 RepID=A0A1M6BN19_9RHOB|nr:MULTISPECIES: DUF2852 domain-containing protein [Palleronia]SEM77546.1 Protein of unknown function [Palleronia pelagia]SHI50057.1 Protein of unknown function [Palleronia salina]